MPQKQEKTDVMQGTLDLLILRTLRGTEAWLCDRRPYPRNQ